MRPLRLGAVLSIFLLALTACVTSRTELISSWRDPAVGPVTFNKILAVAMTRNEARRRTIEDRMVADIERYGAEAVPSYRMISTADTRNDEAVKAAMLKGGFDGAVTWHTVGVNRETHYVPGGVTAVPIGYGGFWGYYDMGWATVYDPGYLRTDKIVRVQTMVYQVGSNNDRLIWTGTSDTVDPRSLDNLVDGVSDATIEAMRREGMFAKR